MKAIWNAYNKLAAALCISGIAVVLVLGGLQVWFRYVSGASLVWSEEVMRYIMLWLVMIGSGLAYSRGQFMGMRFLVDRLPPSVRRGCDVISALLMLSFLGVIGWYGAQFAWKTRLQLSTTIDISLIWIHSAIVVGSALMALHIVLDEILNQKEMRPVEGIAE
jgi:TRAP-type C4-dicarboxylate transport system permease small subunit